MNFKKVLVTSTTFLLISVIMLLSLSSVVQAIYLSEQGTAGDYLKFGPNKLNCGYSAISVGVGTGYDTIVQTGKGGLVDLVGDLLVISIGVVTSLDDDFYASQGLISIGISVAIYDHNIKSYVNPNQVLGGSTPIYEKDTSGTQVGINGPLYWAVTVIAGKIYTPAGIILGALAFIQTPGGMTTEYYNNANTAKWRAEGGPLYYVDYDHQEIKWDGLLTGLDDDDSHSYEVKIRVDILHTGNFDYGLDSVYYNFYINKKPPTTLPPGGGGGKPPVAVPC